MNNSVIALPVINILDFVRNKETRDFDEVQHQVEFQEVNGMIVCSDFLALDYYGEFRGNVSWIHPALELWASEQGCYWEWENCESISLAS